MIYDNDRIVFHVDVNSAYLSWTAVKLKLNEICSSYCNLFSTIKPQQRGYELERIMYEIFSLFDLDPKA
ncbi:hypothetical protein [Clostridium butyricum]